ncbi:hypothetical protein DEJ45_18935 [Streptomyces venezuelae]|uniref:hypothetical protein n=1 Tax=Streptomyces venezuelae TaxID=54571 RepID=UPI00123DEFDD|nr:hypothetical protein [Streptomyces venezuelae]QES14263.1 hypothetical protein DEJ45_18935 [Streptomyces venezuelae]
MPVITLMSPDPGPGRPALARLAEAVTGLLGIPAEHCWVLWQRLDADAAHRPDWRDDGSPCAPVGFVTCKETYPKELVSELLLLLRDELSTLLAVPADEVYLVVRRAVPGELLVRGNVWQGDAKVPAPTGS